MVQKAMKENTFKIMTINLKSKSNNTECACQNDR